MLDVTPPNSQAIGAMAAASSQLANIERRLRRTEWMSRATGALSFALVVGMLTSALVGVGLIYLLVSALAELGPSEYQDKAPGFIAGRWLEKGLGKDYEVTRKAFENALPLQRVCMPEDVAAMIAFLASDAASYVTGQTIVVDGGITLGGSVAPP